MTSKREAFIQEFSEAFGKGNTEHVAATVTDDIRWNLIGSETIEGKDAVIKALQTMLGNGKPQLHIEHIISHGKTVAVNGTLTLAPKSGGEYTYGFCNIIDLSGFKNALVKQITTYQIQIDAPSSD